MAYVLEAVTGKRGEDHKFIVIRSDWTMAVGLIGASNGCEVYVESINPESGVVCVRPAMSKYMDKRALEKRRIGVYFYRGKQVAETQGHICSLALTRTFESMSFLMVNPGQELFLTYADQVGKGVFEPREWVLRPIIKHGGGDFGAAG